MSVISNRKWHSFLTIIRYSQLSLIKPVSKSHVLCAVCMDCFCLSVALQAYASLLRVTNISGDRWMFPCPV